MRKVLQFAAEEPCPNSCICHQSICTDWLAGGAEEDALIDQGPIIESIASIREYTADGRSLPTPAYIMVFPIISAVLSWPIPSPLHEPALSALALHVSPDISLPRTSMLALLYQVLETMPAYR